MPIHMVCPCGTHFNIPDSREGVPFRCHMCAKELVAKVPRAVCTQFFDTQAKAALNAGQSEAFSAVPLRLKDDREAITTSPGLAPSVPREDIGRAELFEIIFEAMLRVGPTGSQMKKRLTDGGLPPDEAEQFVDGFLGSRFDVALKQQKAKGRKHLWLAGAILLYVVFRIVFEWLTWNRAEAIPVIIEWVVAVGVGGFYLLVYYWIQFVKDESTDWEDKSISRRY